jgi:two-component system nitrogen regulation sensor histidine kinase NtrY
MLSFLKRNLFITILFLLSLFVGFLTFLTFIDKSFIELSENNLQTLLIINSILLFILLILIYLEISSSFKKNINLRGSVANKKYIIFFSLFTLIPSFLISVFSLFLFNFALDKYLDKKITTAVNNSYEIAKKYVDEKRNKIESDIVLVAYDLNKFSNLFFKNPNQFKQYLNTQKILRNIDHLYLINNKGELILSADDGNYFPIEEKALKMVLNDERPLKIINAFENKSAAIIKLSNYENTYLYVIKFLDQSISKYLTESEEAINFYYTVENQNLGIKISFAIIYIIIVTLLLFISITIAIRFSTRFFISINNLISASNEIGKGNLNTKVPEIKADKEMEILNKNFNAMIDKLKVQQNKLLISERHEAWENIARKLAHEIKNPLTPMQLTIDNLKTKYSSNLDENNKKLYEKNLLLMKNQIKQIENLVNEFSDFARMPKPLYQKNKLIKLVSSNIELLKKLDSSIKINFNFKGLNELEIHCDAEQISRVILNLIKNSIESIQEKALKTVGFDKKITIDISELSNYILITITDTGIGFPYNEEKDLIKPYYTTKKNGSGLGLSIVNKIIYDHNGKLNFVSQKNGAKVELTLPLNLNNNV